MYESFACMFTGKSVEGIRSTGSEMMGGCKPPYGCWELNLGRLQG